jgi:hypothetical protein
MNYSSIPEFDRELKGFAKKWRSIPSDLEVAKKTLPLLFEQQGDESLDTLQGRRDAFFNNKRATILSTREDGTQVIKMRLDCASLGSKDIVRLVFVFILSHNSLTFIELYSKNDKQREDATRIRQFIK